MGIKYFTKAKFLITLKNLDLSSNRINKKAMGDLTNLNLLNMTSLILRHNDIGKEEIEILNKLYLARVV